MVLSSIIYKHETSRINKLPVLEETGRDNEDAPFYLYIFFSQKNCKSCFNIIQDLNDLPSYFKVFGVVPDQELKEEKQLRHNTGATFPLVGSSKFKKYIPRYIPTIIGVSQKGDILFVLPGVFGKKESLKILENLYIKLYRLLSNDEQFEKGGGP